MSISVNVGDWRGHDVVLASGDKLGKLEDVYYDADSDEPVFLAVKSSLMSHKQVLVPVGDAHATPDHLTVAWSTDDIDGAPTTKPGEELSADDEERVFRRYGLDYTPPANPGGHRLVRR